jgi:hypothetical protein
MIKESGYHVYIMSFSAFPETRLNLAMSDIGHRGDIGEDIVYRRYPLLYLLYLLCVTSLGLIGFSGKPKKKSSQNESSSFSLSYWQNREYCF